MVQLLTYIALTWGSAYVVSASYSIVSRSTSVNSDLVCSTAYGTSPMRIPLSRTTSKYVTHTHITISNIYTPSTTSTPITTSTTTATDTQTNTVTASTTTDTSISTVTNTQTNTEIYTNTDYTTTTFSESTSTVSTLPVVTSTEKAGFTPIQSARYVTQAGGGSYGPPVANREAKMAKRGKLPKPSTSAGSTYYQTAVTCYRTFTSMTFTFETSTASSTTLTAPTSTDVTTTTVTVTTASTETPADVVTTATTTVYQTATITNTVESTSTVSTTTTSTSTSYAPAPTFYDVCSDPANYLDYIGPNTVDDADGNSGHKYVAEATASYDCCVACQKMNQDRTGCGASTFLEGKNLCYLLPLAGTEVCDPTQGVGYFYSSNATANSGQVYTVNNGNCGQVYYQGVD